MKTFKALLTLIFKFFVGLLILLIILLSLSSIYHFFATKYDKQLLLNYLGNHHHFVKTEAGTYSVYEKGSGHNVIVFREGLLTPSNILDFMPLATALSKNHKVIMIDPLGYGMSGVSTTERTNAEINKEYHAILSKVTGNQDKITLINHSISAAYTMDYIHRYPGTIDKVMNIDGSRPINGMKMADATKFSKADLAPIANKMGLFRIGLAMEWGREWSGYNKILKEQTPLYNGVLKKQYTTLNKWAFLTSDMVKYAKESNNNIARVAGMKYPKDMKVLSVVASSTVKSNSAWIKMQKEAFSNPAIQHTIELTGSHYLHHSSKKLAVEIEDFLK